MRFSDEDFNNNNNKDVVASSLKEENNNNSAAADLLAGMGVKPYELCVHLAAEYGTERVAEVVNAARAKAKHNAPGWVRDALRYGWKFLVLPTKPSAEDRRREAIQLAECRAQAIKAQQTDMSLAEGARLLKQALRGEVGHAR